MAGGAKRSRLARERRREEAARRMTEVRALATRTILRDARTIHVTVLVGRDRFDWWPGSMRWHGPDGRGSGGMNYFLAALLRCRLGPPRDVEDDPLIDEEDEVA